MSLTTINELLELRKALELENQDATTLLDILDQASKAQVTPQLLHQTSLGRTVASLKKSEYAQVSQRAKEIVLAWKSVVMTELPVPKQANAPVRTSSSKLPISSSSASSSLPTTSPARAQSCPKLAIPTNPLTSPPRSVSAPKPSTTPVASSTTPTLPPSPMVQSPVPSPSSSLSPASRLSEAILSPIEPELQRSESSIYKLNSTDNKVRNKMQELIFGVFADTASELVKTEIAVRLEASLFTKHGSCGTEYRDHSREILGNLRDPKNPALKFHLLTGAWTTEELVQKSVYELAGDDLKKQRQEDAIWMEGWRRADWQQANRPKGGCDLFKCAKCGARDTTWTQKQTRSADEPMTTFILCNNCGKRWRMC